jgi:hypothetical protein
MNCNSRAEKKIEKLWRPRNGPKVRQINEKRPCLNPQTIPIPFASEQIFTW